MIPSGYKEDVVYSPVPTSGAGDLSFTRASNGTRVNSAGLVEVCPWNLLEYSEDFSNVYWGKVSATITTNTTVAPNGTTTADTLVITSGGYLLQQPTISIGVGFAVTISIYAKNQTNNFLLFGGATPAGNDVYTIQDAGNGWYRHINTRTFTASGTSVQFIIYDQVGTNFIWGAQLNIGATAKPYFPTTDRLNVPRLTYQNGGGGCPSLLLEKQSTNLVTYSEQFDNAAWNKANVTVSANTTTSPSGQIDADTLDEGSANNTHNINNAITVSSGVNTTFSIYVKKDTMSFFRLVLNENITTTGWVAVQFNLDTLTYTSGVGSTGGTFVSASIENVGNSWYRCTLVGSLPITGAALFLISPSNGNTISSSDSRGRTIYLGTNKKLFIWGAQAEASSYPTSYIPTTSASATRVADACFKTGISSLIGQTEGTAFVEIKTAIIDSAGQIILSLDDGTTSNRMEIFALGSGDVGFYIETGGASQANTVSSFTLQNNMKLAFAYKQNDFVLYINGTQVGTDTTGTVPTASAFRLQPNVSNGGFSVKSYGEAVLFKTRLTNAELASLTTI
jgi:hypothetical protein